MPWSGAFRCEFDGKSMETETTTWYEFPNGGKAIVEQIPASEERNKSKRVWVLKGLSLGLGFERFEFWTFSKKGASVSSQKRDKLAK